jgi:fatty acyl-CoA reductase
VHVSTAYSQWYQDELRDVPYLPPYDPSDFIKTIQSMPENILKRIEPILLDSMEGVRPFPNTYTYSKYFAEAVVATEGEGIPRAILRPSIGEDFKALTRLQLIIFSSSNSNNQRTNAWLGR